MKNIKLWLVMFLSFALLTLYGVTLYNQSVASKTTAQAQGRAAIIQALGQARLDSAQANATNLGAMFPYAVLAASLILAVSLLALGVMIILRPNYPPGGKQIEHIQTKTIILITPGQSRRELFKLLGGNQ